MHAGIAALQAPPAQVMVEAPCNTNPTSQVKVRVLLPGEVRVLLADRGGVTEIVGQGTARGIDYALKLSPLSITSHSHTPSPQPPPFLPSSLPRDENNSRPPANIHSTSSNGLSSAPMPATSAVPRRSVRGVAL